MLKAKELVDDCQHKPMGIAAKSYAYNKALNQINTIIIQLTKLDDVIVSDDCRFFTCPLIKERETLDPQVYEDAGRMKRSMNVLIKETGEYITEQSQIIYDLKKIVLDYLNIPESYRPPKQ